MMPKRLVTLSSMCSVEDRYLILRTGVKTVLDENVFFGGKRDGDETERRCNTNFVAVVGGLLWWCLGLFLCPAAWFMTCFCFR